MEEADRIRIEDIERRLRAIEMLAQPTLARGFTGDTFHPWIAESARIKALAAENAELRRTISLMAKTATEVQDNFRLIAELAADPADEKRKEPRNYVEFPSYAIGNLAEIKEPKE